MVNTPLVYPPYTLAILPPEELPSDKIEVKSSINSLVVKLNVPLLFVFLSRTAFQAVYTDVLSLPTVPSLYGLSTAKGSPANIAPDAVNALFSYEPPNAL